MSQKIFSLSRPLPKYGAESVLKKELIHFLFTAGFQSGDPFLTDRELVDATKKSRTFVRRALKLMQKEGWIERISGVGTFVTQQVEDERMRQTGDRTVSSSQNSGSLFRIAAMTVHSEFSVTWSQRGWCMQVLEGINEVNDDDSIVIEYFGNQAMKPDLLSRRLMRSCPNLILCLGPPENHIFVIGESIRLGIPCILAGVRCPAFRLPNIFDDGVEAVSSAVEHLVQLGHQRIGFVQLTSSSGQWVFDRLVGYEKGCRRFGADQDGRLTFWIYKTEFVSEELESQAEEATIQAFEKYLDCERPTALIFGCSKAAFPLQALIHRRKILVPEDLSFIVFDQDPSLVRQFGGINPTTIRLPLREIGHRVFQISKSIKHGENVPFNTSLPCELIPGESTLSISSSSFATILNSQGDVYVTQK